MKTKTPPHLSPNIFLSDTITSYSLQRGIARSFQHTVSALSHQYKDAVILYTPQDRPESFEGRYRKSPRFRGSNFIRLHDIAASLRVVRERTDVFYSPYYGNAYVSAPQIFTVYDMIHERFPQYFSHTSIPVKSFIAEKKRCIKRASFLLAISSATARDILAVYPHIDPAKIVVTPLGVEEHFFETTTHTPWQGPPYFLYVGHRSLYKNFGRALIAFGESGLAADFELRVVSPAGTSFAASEQETVRRYNLQGRVHLVTGISELALRTLYADAVALIYPSEYEGFGLPILEAMASGTLVATSNVSSMPEVGGAVAEYFDPYSTESIAASLQRLATLPEESRGKRVADGIARARTFTWARCHEQTIAAFERCLDAR